MIIKKLTHDHQKKWIDNQFFSKNTLNKISSKVQLHTELNNVRSSAAACINVLGNLDRNDLKNFLNSFDLEIDNIIDFPSTANISGEIYDDIGPIIYEWIGPKKSPINEPGGKRGQNRTSIDAYLLAEINDKITQIFIEWKFTEVYSAIAQLQRFSGEAGSERLRRYSKSFAKLRKEKDVPFDFQYEGGIGLFDFGYEPIYQLLRMTLLAKLTTPIKVGEYHIEDYRILHLSHSDNEKLNTIRKSHVKYCPHLTEYIGESLHNTWHSLLSQKDRVKFKHGFWNKELGLIQNNKLKDYLEKRYK